MRLILARHGNTFGPEDRVVWVGARSDLPLVGKGRAQAAAIGKALLSRGMVPTRIHAGPLQRTVQTAAIAAEAMGLCAAALTIAPELREIDYGCWEGRSNAEIRAAHGDRAIDGWQQDSRFPQGFGWSPPEGEIRAQWQAFLARLPLDRDETVLVVSSNGIYRVIAQGFGIPAAAAKMDTGALSVLHFSQDRIAVACWNTAPGDLPHS